MKKLLCILMFVVSGIAQGDTVTLNNGDKISGTITDFDDTQVVVTTEYAGTIPIQRAGIASIETDDARVLLIETAEAPVEARLVVEEGKQQLETSEGRSNLALEQVAGIYTVPEAPEVPKAWSGTVVAGATLRSGNTDTMDATLTAEAIREKEKNKLTLSAFAAYGEVESTLSTRRYKGEGKFQLYPREKLYWYILGSAEQDDGRKLDNRFVVATGVGYDWVKNDKRSLSTEIGIQETWEEWAPYTPAGKDALKASNRALATTGLQAAINTLSLGVVNGNLISNVQKNFRLYLYPLADYDGRSNDYLAARFALSYEQSLFEKAILTEDLVLIPSIEEFGEFRLSNTFGLSTPLTQSMKLQFSLLSEYDSHASDSSVDEWDHTLITGVSYGFGGK